MASMIQSSTFAVRQSHNNLNVSSPNRNGDSTYIRGSVWPGAPSIWQVTPQERPIQGSASLRTVSPTQSDSLTGPKSPHAPSRHGSREVIDISAAHPLHIANSSTIPVSSSVGRSSHTSNSPPRQRGSGSLSAHTTSRMPHFGTATLLNGSAPDVDLQARDTYCPLRSTRPQTKPLNAEGVDEFVPAKQKHRALPSQLRHGSAWTPTLDINHHDFFPEEMRGNGPLSQEVGKFDAGLYGDIAATHTGGCSFQHGNQDTDNLPSSPCYSQAQPLSGALTNLHLNHRRPMFSTQAPRHLFRHEPVQQKYGHRDHAYHGDTLSYGPAGRNDSTKQDDSDTQLLYQNWNGTSSSSGPGQNGTGSHGFASYSPSQTPPTAPGSRRSNSGSGTSTRASSQSVDTRFTSFDASANFFPGRQQISSGQLTQSGLSYPMHGFNSYNPVFIPTSSRTSRNNAGQNHHMPSSEVRIQQEKELNLSPLIKDFRANYKIKKYDLKDAYNHIVEFSGDQHGSRFIQAKLETANSEEKEKVFSEIQENALQLMTDIFGNYVIQKMFEHGTQAQKKVLANQMRGRVYYLTTQVYGCRVVQKALEHVLTDQQASMVKELEGNVLSIVENQNGNHVIQKAIERIPSEHIQFIFDAHVGHVVRLSRHNYGCRVVQRILEHAPPPVKRSVLGELRDAIPNLIEDQFGNYVMQHIIRNGEVADRQMVVSLVRRSLLHFSKHKFASNVVEAAIECADVEQREDILRTLTTGFDSQGQSQVYGLIRDQYGNYVIQKVLARLQGAALDNLVSEIQHHLVTLRKISHGKQVSAMEKALAEAHASMPFQDSGHASQLHIVNADAQHRSLAFSDGYQHSRALPTRLCNRT